MNVYRVTMRRNPSCGFSGDYRTDYVLAQDLTDVERLVSKDQARKDKSHADWWERNNGYRRGRSFGEDIDSVEFVCVVTVAKGRTDAT